MSVVMALDECLARPDSPGEPPFLLVPHLEAVAAGAGDPRGTVEEKLAFLAGLAHDAAKAAREWQTYIRGGRKKGPPHAPLGAALFAFWADQLIGVWATGAGDKERYGDLLLDWARVIHGHHGHFPDLDVAPPWAISTEDQAALLSTCDVPGLDALIRRHFPDYPADLAAFPAWLDGFDRKWERRGRIGRPNLARRLEAADKEALGMRLPALGGRLIFADRRHAAAWNTEAFAATDAAPALACHERLCRAEAERGERTGADRQLLAARNAFREEAVATWNSHPQAAFLTLLLPTGYGKTLTGLRVALEALRSGRCRRLIYVAPYLSILSQAARQIEQATGLPVFLHHHLTALGLEDHQPYDLLDTWQAPIIATTFNQLFRGLFPQRAQECLRLPALDDAFLFVDEPQIVDVGVWCAFLRALSHATASRRCQVLLSTATLPPLEDGLGPGRSAVPLVRPATPSCSRYRMRTVPDPWTTEELVEKAASRFREHPSVAVILNTVRDAVEVFQRLRGRQPWRFLSAAMLPGHKAAIIRDLRGRLDPGKPQPTGVVCTQVLEAGVDLSFRSLLRARALWPSHAQAAGRANRHGEGEPAEVLVFPFLREDGKESRNLVYRDQHARAATDELLSERPEVEETEVPGLLAEYFRRCRERNPHTTSLQRFGDAALGKWSALGGLEPFAAGGPETEVLIPGAETWLEEPLQRLLTDFRAITAEELLDRYLDRGFRKGLSFRDRKRLTALLRQCTVAVPARVVDAVATPAEEGGWLYVLNRREDYDPATGLAHLGTTQVECPEELGIL